MKARTIFKKLAVTATAAIIALHTVIVPVAAAPRIEKAKHKGKGRIEVDFRQDVRYKNVKVTVKDNKGKSYKVSIVKRDDDDLDFKIKNYKTGRTYTYKITGIKKWNERKYGSVSGKVAIPAPKKKAAAPKVESVEYDAEDREVNIDFKGNVQWKNAKVTITSGGTNYAQRIIEKDNDDIDVKVKGLQLGKKYSYKITGIRAKGASAYTTVSGTFTAYDD